MGWGVGGLRWVKKGFGRRGLVFGKEFFEGEESDFFWMKARL